MISSAEFDRGRRRSTASPAIRDNPAMDSKDVDGAIAANAAKRVRFTFPKAVRLCRRREFEAVFERGRRARLGVVTVCALARPGEPLRVGLSVSRRCGNAVARNRIKRRFREAFRLERPTLPAGFDLVIIPTSGCRDLSLEEARRLLRTGVERLTRPSDDRKAADRRR
jgi:ribonuclease P protein component